MATTSLEQRVRESLQFYLSPEVGAYAQMSLHDMQQTIAGSHIPSPEQTQALARRMHLR
jgi:hypothetical protein